MNKIKFISNKKITNRVFQSNHPMIKKRIESVNQLSYKLFAHNISIFDKSKPIFTIILTMHDANINFIKESLQSVFGQSYFNTEVILINDGAKGKVENLIWDYFTNNTKSKLIETTKHEWDPSQDDLGNPIVNLWNAGLFCSQGDYVNPLSYDDKFSIDYAERMVNLFLLNSNCNTASPLVCSINENSEVNVEGSEYLRLRNIRDKYTNGVELAKSFMREGNMIMFPGTLLASKSQLVLDLGGFDNIYDLSQLFRFGIHGDSGFDPEAKLFWRYHKNQGNKYGRKLGLVYVKVYKVWLKNYGIETLHKSIGGDEFANEFKMWYRHSCAVLSIDSVECSLSYGLIPYLKAVFRLLSEGAPLSYLGMVLIRFPHDISYYIYKNYFPKFMKRFTKRVYRFLKSFFYS